MEGPNLFVIDWQFIAAAVTITILQEHDYQHKALGLF